MKSKKPFFSRELIYNNMKRFWWVGVLYTLVLFLVSPLIALTNGSDTIPRSGYNVSFITIFEGTIIFLFTVPVFIGIMVFRYMQNSRAMVTIHAMPYTRLRLYVNNIISGLILLLAPILLNSAFLSIIQLGGFGGTYFKEGIVLKYLAVSTLTSVTLYVWTIFVGMFTGSSIAQIIFTYILNFLLAGIVAVGQFLLSGVLYGFVMNEDICLDFLHISPLAQVMFLSSSSPEPGIIHFLIIDVIIAIVMLVAGYFVYKYRNLETAGDVISGKYVKPIFKYGVTTCVMLVGALYVREIASMDSVNIFIYLLFALIGYIVAEMLLRKSFKIWDSYKGFIYFGLVFAIIFFGIKADLFGYENYIPDIAGIKCAALNANAQFDTSTPEEPEYGILYNKDNIGNIVNLHEALIKDKNINLTDNMYTDAISISYEMNDGRIIKRAYSFEEGRYDELIEKIKDSEEYIRATNRIFDYNVDDIYSARISNMVLGDEVYVSIDNKEEIKELFEAMKLDIINEKTIDKKEFRDIYMVELTVKQKEDDDVKVVEQTYSNVIVVGKDATFISETFNKNADNINEFIKRKGYDKSLKNTERVISIKLNYNDGRVNSNVITEKDKIEEVINLLYSFSNGYDRRKDYISLEISLNNNSNWINLNKEKAMEIIELFE